MSKKEKLNEILASLGRIEAALKIRTDKAAIVNKFKLNDIVLVRYEYGPSPGELLPGKIIQVTERHNEMTRYVVRMDYDGGIFAGLEDALKAVPTDTKEKKKA